MIQPHLAPALAQIRVIKARLRPLVLLIGRVARPKIGPPTDDLRSR